MFRLRSIARSAGVLVLAVSWADAQGVVGQDATGRAAAPVRITRAVLDAAGGAVAGPRLLRLRATSLGSVFQTGLSSGRFRLTPGFVQQIRIPAAVQPLVGDFDGNGGVNFDDFFLFAVAFGKPGTGGNAKFDLSRDGRVDFDDFFLFAAQFGKKRT